MGHETRQKLSEVADSNVLVHWDPETDEVIFWNTSLTFNMYSVFVEKGEMYAECVDVMTISDPTDIKGAIDKAAAWNSTRRNEIFEEQQ